MDYPICIFPLFNPVPTPSGWRKKTTLRTSWGILFIMIAIIINDFPFQFIGIQRTYCTGQIVNSNSTWLLILRRKSREETKETKWSVCEFLFISSRLLRYTLFITLEKNVSFIVANLAILQFFNGKEIFARTLISCHAKSFGNSDAYIPMTRTSRKDSPLQAAVPFMRRSTLVQEISVEVRTSCTTVCYIN